jgi:hypothetical protein
MARALLKAVFQAGLDAVHGRRAVADYLAHTPIDRPV